MSDETLLRETLAEHVLDDSAAAIRGVGEALGTHGHADDPQSRSDRQPGASTGVVCEACPFASCDGCEAEVARRANGEAK